LQDKRKAGMFNAYLSGFTLVCFVLGLLVSHPKVPVNTNVMFPKLSGESAYSLMALLGTNIIVHNFYTHSSVVQVNFQHPVLMFFLKKQWQELCLSIKTNEVYLQARIARRNAKHHERLAHPHDATEYTIP
jgi:Mn2+/Fe2+ NRAMP family transporter